MCTITTHEKRGHEFQGEWGGLHGEVVGRKRKVFKIETPSV